MVFVADSITHATVFGRASMMRVAKASFPSVGWPDAAMRGSLPFVPGQALP